MTNEEYITRIVEQDEDFCIITDEVNGTVNIEVSLDWWKKQSNSDEDCISRAKLIDKTIKRNSIWIKITDSRGMNLQEIIDELPSIQPKPKTDVLDKIRIEIEQTSKDYEKFGDYRYVDGLWMALGIIDKHKAESEDKE